MAKKQYVTLLLAACALASASASAGAGTGQVGPRPFERQPYIPDIATFLQIGSAMPVDYSWDGERILFTSSMSGARQVYRLNDRGWPYQLTAFEDGIDYCAPAWNAPLAIVGASVGGSERAQLYLMDTATGRVEQLTHFEDVQVSSVIFARDDRSIFYRSNEENGRDFFIYRMDLATGETTKVFGAENGIGGYNSIYELSPDGRYLIIGNLVSNTRNDLFLLDVETLAARQLNAPDVESRHTSVWMMPDDRTIWLLCNGNDEGIARLARMRVGSPAVEYVDDGWVDPRWEIETLGFSRDFKYIHVLVNEDGYQRLKVREFESGREVPVPPLAGIVSPCLIDRHGRMLLGFNGPTRTADVWRWDPARGDLQQLTFSSYAGIDPALFREPELIRFRSFDGLEIPAFLYLPPGYRPGEPVPFIIHAHGGPESQYRPRFQRNIQYLVLNGYGLLAPNVRGSGGYGRYYQNLDNYERRKDSLADYKAAADWLIAGGYTRPEMLGIRGGSYGGYVVLGMVTEYPDLFSAAVDVVGIANFETFLENTSAYRRALREAEYGPLSAPEFLRSISPIHKADRIRTPLLVVHGENDPRVPVGEARQIIRAVRASGGEVDSLIFTDEGHGTGKRDNTVEEYRKQVAFFGCYLKRQTR